MEKGRKRTATEKETVTNESKGIGTEIATLKPKKETVFTELRYRDLKLLQEDLPSRNKVKEF